MNDKETKWREECKAVGFTWIEKVDRRYSKCSCNMCGHIDDYQQGAIRRGEVKCSHCHQTKMVEECKAVGFTWVGRAGGAYSKCSCNVCGHVDDYRQDHIRRGNVKCSQCYETKMREECSAVGLTWIAKVDAKYSMCSCNVCGHVDDYVQSDIRRGEVKCTACQITKYKSKLKQGWTFINHYYENKQSYVNLKHSCSDTIVKVHTSNYLKGSYDCPHCMHTHYSDQSFFYVIQVCDIIKLGISNRPDQRYTQYGLSDDSTIIEHLRIPLETKRDALVVESYAKQLVKDYKIPTEISKQVFTESGYNECYDIECLPMLMNI